MIITHWCLQTWAKLDHFDEMVIYVAESENLEFTLLLANSRKE